MYRYFFALILLAVILPAYADTRTIVTQTPYNPYYGAYYGGDYFPEYSKKNSIFSDINELERYALNKNFMNDNDITRLERLEMQAFGDVQQGNLMKRYDNARDAILTRPKQNYKTSLWRSINNYFNGQLTGYTTPINQSDYNYPYGRSINNNFRTPYGRGYRTNNYGLSSGTGVRILD